MAKSFLLLRLVTAIPATVAAVISNRWNPLLNCARTSTVVLEYRIMERITHAAILRTDNCIVFDRDHADCIKRSPEGSCGKDVIQGFLTNKFRFVNRKAAASIAFQAGQIDNIAPDDILVSEQLWWPEGDGRYDYDEKLGYIEDREND